MLDDVNEVYVDEEWYLNRYPDVQREILAGRQQSARKHYLKHGLGEGRQPFGFDSDWYLQTNPDIALALDKGGISPQEHYSQYGRFEGRLPLPPTLAAKHQVFAFGAYGTNNVGDEAIFEGLKLQFPGAVQVFYNKTISKNSIILAHALAYKRLFNQDSHLIIGGGGLLYARSALQDMISLANTARVAGSRVDVLGIGCEAAEESYHREIRELISLADNVSVRTSMSAEILRAITGRTVDIQKDFAFSLGSELPLQKKRVREVPLIGVVTGGDVRSDFSALVSAISSSLRGPKSLRADFVHIPHSRAFIDLYNNDVVVGNAIWSQVRIDELRNEESFRLQSFSADPRVVLKSYTELDGVMSARFHGLVFAHMIGLPTLVMEGQTLKNQSFIRDFDSSNLFVSKTKGDLRDTYRQFFESIKRR